MLKMLAFALILSYVLALANAELAKYPDGCDDKCREYIKECGERCLDLNYCPNSFPPFNRECPEECQRYLLACKERCFVDIRCKCPHPDDACPFPGASFSNKECCEEDVEFQCLSFYCPAAGQPWQCIRKCPVTEPPKDECDKDCYCPDLKEDKCLFTGMTIKNKDCCGHNPSQGCQEFYCPVAGSLWQCKERCCECPHRREICHFKGAYIRNLECCKMDNSGGCSAWYCPIPGQPWQCTSRCP